MKTNQVQAHDFLRNIDTANAELGHADAVCALLIDSYTNVTGGGSTMSSEVIIAAIADINAKIRRIKDEVDGAYEAWSNAHKIKSMAA